MCNCRFADFMFLCKKFNHYEGNKTNHRSICNTYDDGLQRTI